MAKQRARRGEPPPPASTVVIRGDLLDPDTSAQWNFEVYGFYGISVLAETTDVSWDDLGTAHRVVPNPHHSTGG